MSRVAEIFKYDIYNMTRHQLHMNFNIVGQKWVLNKVKSLFLQKKIIIIKQKNAYSVVGEIFLRKSACDPDFIVYLGKKKVTDFVVFW